jgi:hypothetical protein
MLYCLAWNMMKSWVSETWLKSQMSDGALDPSSNYRIYKKDRKSSKAGGGICFLINNNFKSYVVDNVDNDNVEIISCTASMNT